eukprot:CAMPEP_0197394632 /NCGR_PEP_ID=MMETSP1165-20131217/5634_1 /TAXON_ID=284809 /ORGANISM="Chrysocystis fragilis, Strain CCMP3189" /LENGTH=578 /DNA_ID=CAMNT_0042920355 /DNA_START=13 /DNA_END=1749 /DNA_ORIENTATION=-
MMLVGFLALAAAKVPFGVTKNPTYKTKKVAVDDILAALPRRLEAANDLYYHAQENYPATNDNFWVFGVDGVFIYTNEGEEVMRMTYNEICKRTWYEWPTGSGNWYTYYGCDFYSAVTDGSEYVFVAKDENGGKIAVFTYFGLYLGQYETCRWPVGLDYSPHRHEVWVHCYSPTTEDGGFVDVMSVGAWGLNHPAIPLPNQTLDDHTHGWIELDAMTPDYAWATTREHPYIAKINVHTHEVSTYDVSHLGCGAVNQMAVSWRNKHLYTKCHVCCTCGLNDEAEVYEDCSLWPEYIRNFTRVDGTTDWGYCGIACDGSEPDTVGLIEFDTLTGTVVGTHYWPEFGSGDPVSSSDGQFIVMTSPAGDSVKILKVGENGELSNDDDAADVYTGFTDGAHQDTLWILEDKYELVLFSSNDENYLVVEDLHEVLAGGEAESPKTITLSDATTSTAIADRWYKRSMAWAEGTDKVMVGGAAAEELYIVSLDSMKVEKTIPAVNNTFIIHVKSPDDESKKGEDGDDGKDEGRVFGIIALAISAFCLLLTCFVLAFVLRKLRTFQLFAETAEYQRSMYTNTKQVDHA